MLLFRIVLEQEWEKSVILIRWMELKFHEVLVLSELGREVGELVVVSLRSSLSSRSRDILLSFRFLCFVHRRRRMWRWRRWYLRRWRRK